MIVSMYRIVTNQDVPTHLLNRNGPIPSHDNYKSKFVQSMICLLHEYIIKIQCGSLALLSNSSKCLK